MPTKKPFSEKESGMIRMRVGIESHSAIQTPFGKVIGFAIFAHIKIHVAIGASLASMRYE
jgi:hypothetical protein